MFLPQQSVKQGIKKGPMCSNHDYAFRCYVISHLPSLLVLDDHAIDADEREEARKVYGNRRVSVSSKKVSKKHKEKVSNLAISPCLQMTVFKEVGVFFQFLPFQWQEQNLSSLPCQPHI